MEVNVTVTRERVTTATVRVTADDLATAMTEVRSWSFGRLDQEVRSQGVWLVEDDAITSITASSSTSRPPEAGDD